MIIYDTETVRAIPSNKEPLRPNIEYAKDWNDFSSMKIACVGVFDMATERTRVFLKDNLEEFGELLAATDCAVGFNNKRFDNRLLIANGVGMPNPSKFYDILEEVWTSLGIGTTYRHETHGGLSLDALVYANFRIRKTGKGADAPIDWQEGRKGKVIDYCLADVELTRRLLDKIIKCGRLRNPKTSEDIFIRKPSPEVN